ncbi:MAG: hypothetical protein ABH881_01775 [bacterium]
MFKENHITKTINRIVFFSKYAIEKIFKNPEEKLIKDLIIIVFSIIIAVIFLKTGVFEEVLSQATGLKFVGSFVAGSFFVSIFTAVPATVALLEISQHNSILLVSLLGGLGAMTGDFIIFKFTKDYLSEDVMYLAEESKHKKVILFFQSGIFRRLAPFVGALFVASPLPDEIGLMLMGMSRIKMRIFLPLSFSLNFLGILVMTFIAKVI